MNTKVLPFLTEHHQNRRSQICQVCIKVNFIAWLVEFSGCLTLTVDLLLVGSKSNAATEVLGKLTMLCFFVLLPCTFLINSSEGINAIVDYSWGDAMMRIFKPTKEIEKPVAGQNAKMNK